MSKKKWMKNTAKILAIGSFFISTIVSADLKSMQYENWSLHLKYDSFDDKYEPTLRSKVYTNNNKEVGLINIHLFNHTNFITFRIDGLSGAFPYCDYEFTKYRVDNGESQYFPSFGVACPLNTIDDDVLAKLISGNQLDLRIKKEHKYVKLDGFTEAWNKASTYIKD